jgi:DNA-binding Xre family transcriptional regulator
MPHPEFQNLTGCLRAIMKAKKVTYASLAKHLEVSEATMKRFFTANDGSIGRITEICSALSISFADLVEQSKSKGEHVFALSLEQENFFATHPNYFAFFQELLEKNLSPKEIRTKHRISQHSATRYLRQLDKMGLIEWLPSDRVKLKVQGTHNWLDGGPLQQKFLPADNLAFLKYVEKNFQQDSHFLTTSNRHVHPETLRALISELKPLFSSFRKRVYRDEVFYPKSELIPTKWLMGIAPHRAEPLGKIEDL